MESKIISITIKIGEEEITLPFEDAKRLYEELKTLFEPKPTISVSGVWEPYTTPIKPWTTVSTPNITWTTYPYVTYSNESGISGTMTMGSTN